MPTINDYKKKALNDLGYSGDITTAEYKWLRDICSPYKGSIPDMWRYALAQADYTGPLPQAQNKMLSDLGHTGSISNKWYKYWRDTPGQGVGGITWAKWIEGLTESQILDIDFSYTDRHFQNQTNTLADDAGENIGLALDSGLWGGASLSSVIAAAPQLVTNGDFAAATTGWIGYSGVSLSIVGGALVITSGSSGTNRRAAQQIVADVGRMHFVTVGDLTGAPTSRGQVGTTSAANEILTYAFQGAARYAFFASTSAIYVGFGASTLTAGNSISVDDVSVVSVPGNAGVQASAPLQGKRQAGGVCRYDGSDDNHLTTFLAQNGEMSVLFRGSIAASLSAVQVLIGASGSAANRCWLGVDTAGHLCAGVGSDSSSTIVGTTDVRGKNIVACLTFNGTTVKLFLLVDGVVTEEYSGSQASTPTTTIPFRLAANNNNGTASSYSSIDANQFRAAHKLMDLSDFRSIAASMAAV